MTAGHDTVPQRSAPESEVSHLPQVQIQISNSNFKFQIQIQIAPVADLPVAAVVAAVSVIGVALTTNC